MKSAWWRLLSLFALASADCIAGALIHSKVVIVLGCFGAGCALAALMAVPL